MGMDRKLIAEIAALRTLSTEELRAFHLEVYGQEVKCRDREYLFKRLAFWVQERWRSDQQATYIDGQPKKVCK